MWYMLLSGLLVIISILLGSYLDKKNGHKFFGAECWMIGTVFGIMAGFLFCHGLSLLA